MLSSLRTRHTRETRTRPPELRPTPSRAPRHISSSAASHLALIRATHILPPRATTTSAPAPGFTSGARVPNTAARVRYYRRVSRYSPAGRFLDRGVSEIGCARFRHRFGLIKARSGGFAGEAPRERCVLTGRFLKNPYCRFVQACYACVLSQKR